MIEAAEVLTDHTNTVLACRITVAISTKTMAFQGEFECQSFQTRDDTSSSELFYYVSFCCQYGNDCCVFEGGIFTGPML